MNSIRDEIVELHSILNEVKTLRNTIKIYNQRAAKLENNILTFLKNEKQVGVKYKDMAIVVDNKQKNKTKKKIEAENDIYKILRNNGISDPENLYKEIQNAKKGEVQEVSKLKLRKLKN